MNPPDLPSPADTGPAIRELRSGERKAAVGVINTAAGWYREFLPPEELQGPEMDESGWDAEAERMTWWGAFSDHGLVGVTGSEPIGDVVLLRHLYVLPEHQRSGVAGALIRHVEASAPGSTRMIVAGTYQANYKARGVLEKHGYRPAGDSESVLRTYYDIPEDRLLGSIAYVRRVGPPRR
ncbi:MAG: GNAT family N-acetyltransferase [bacterium]|nr:GNAT family N-acetyltransferase [bacterium]MDE0352664.1 GNAT family N-acetyltransferase [bacterium]